MSAGPSAAEVREFVACVATHRYDDTLAFYTDVLGGVVSRPAVDGVAFKHAVVAIGAGFVEVLEYPPERVLDVNGAVSIVLGVDDVQAWHDALSAMGIEIAFPMVEMAEHRFTFAVLDPNGVRVSFFTVNGS